MSQTDTSNDTTTHKPLTAKVVLPITRKITEVLMVVSSVATLTLSYFLDLDKNVKTLNSTIIRTNNASQYSNSTTIDFTEEGLMDVIDNFFSEASNSKPAIFSLVAIVLSSGLATIVQSFFERKNKDKEHELSQLMLSEECEKLKTELETATQGAQTQRSLAPFNYPGSAALQFGSLRTSALSSVTTSALPTPSENTVYNEPYTVNM